MKYYFFFFFKYLFTVQYSFSVSGGNDKGEVKDSLLSIKMVMYIEGGHP